MVGVVILGGQPLRGSVALEVVMVLAGQTTFLIMVLASMTAACKSGGDTDSDSSASSAPTSTTGAASSSTSADTGAPTTSGTTEVSGTTGGLSCSPSAGCGAAQPECIGLVDNAGAAAYALRMSQVKFTLPAALDNPVLAGAVASAMLLDLPVCNLFGAGTWSWLLQFDSGAGTLRTGAALPMADPFTGYSFIDAMGISPAVMDAPVAGDGSFAAAVGVDLMMPLAVTPDPGGAILLPLRGLILSGTVSADQGCIGRFNAEGLDPGNSCLPDDQTPAFLSGGAMTAYIVLEEADVIDVTTIGQSLCVLLSGDPATYGDGAVPIARCKRDPDFMEITFKGDWCDETNQAATASCSDSVRITADFAASSVKLN